MVFVSWGVADQAEPEHSFTTHVLAQAEERTQQDPTPVGETTPQVDAASNVVPEEQEDDLSSNANVDPLLASEPEASPSPESSPTKPSIKPLAESSSFMKYKPVVCSRPTVPIPQSLQSRDGKAEQTNIIDGATALRVEKAAKEVTKKESSVKGRPSFVTAGSVKKAPFTRTKDGEVKMRKRKCLDLRTVGGKRKRMDVLEEFNKRVATEGRSFATMRARHEVPIFDAMDIDSSGELQGAGLLFSV
jgi:hypothetical protein